jgi:hypothetical protein
MRAFVHLREMLAAHKDLAKKLDALKANTTLSSRLSSKRSTDMAPTEPKKRGSGFWLRKEPQGPKGNNCHISTLREFPKRRSSTQHGHDPFQSTNTLTAFLPTRHFSPPRSRRFWVFFAVGIALLWRLNRISAPSIVILKSLSRLQCCFMNASARFFNSSGETSSLCLAIHQVLPADLSRWHADCRRTGRPAP